MFFCAFHKGRIPLPNRMIFRKGKVPKGGGRAFSIQKFMLQMLGTLTRAFLALN